MKYFNKLTLVLIALVIVFAAVLPAGCSSDEPVEKLDTIRLVGTMGPMSIPLAYMVENDTLSSVAETTTLEIWATPPQLQAIIAGGQGDFLSLPINAAATFYNKGISLNLLDCSIWNILYVVSTDPDIATAADLAGKRVVVPYQGAVPDAIFRYVLQKQGVDPEQDIEIFYAPDPVQASQLLLSGQEQYVLLSEPSATSVMNKAAANGMTVYRNLNLNSEWQTASGDESRSAVAGTVALGAMVENTDVIDVFVEEYRKAVEWMLANPEEAGVLGAEVLSEQGFSAEVLTESMQNIDWDFVTAADGYEDMEGFLSALMELNPNYVGGALPDSAFYYGR